MSRRRKLLYAGIAMAVFALLILVPGYLATRPAFFSDLTDKYEPWKVSTHLEAGCEGCHVAPNPVAKAVYRTRMVGEFYLSVVSPSRVPEVFAKPTNASCLECHNDLRTVSPEGDLQIPHRAHVTILEMECVQCHNFLVHEKSPEGKHTPPMAGCMECHDGDTAKDACSACHTQKDAPESHRSGTWLREHDDQPADAECIGCHKWAEDWCEDCHSQRPASHGKDWRAVHGARIKEHRSCEGCHDGDFCIKCHGEVPQLNFDPTLEMVR